MSKQIFVDVHVLQTVPPSCVNRDDTGSPKTAVYGGCTRARVSSQAWKRAMRLIFPEILGETFVGKRTKHIPELLKAEIAAIDASLPAEKLKKEALNLMNVGFKEKEDKTDALFFISGEQLKAVAELAASGCKDKKAFQQAMNEHPSADIALFGRMVASNSSLNTDAAAQVAHSISTHAVHNEYDYFTAVDDCKPEDNAGAGHLGTVEYNSSTLYRYATVNVTELAKHLGGESAAVVRGFVEAFIESMPTGKQNTFANRTQPDLAYITVRCDQPINLVGAFERPVPAGTEGYVQASVQRLVEYAQKVYSTFADAPEKAFGVGAFDQLSSVAEVMPLAKMLSALEECVAERISGEEVM